MGWYKPAPAFLSGAASTHSSSYSTPRDAHTCLSGERACAAAGARGSLTGGENRRGADMAAGAARLREARLTLRPRASVVVPAVPVREQLNLLPACDCRNISTC